MLLIAFVFVSIAVYCLVLDHNTLNSYRKPLGKHSEQNKIIRYGVLKALGVVKRVIFSSYH